MPKDDPSKPGPEPDRLKIDGDWKDAVKKALNKPRPEGGWPDAPNKDEPSAEGDGAEPTS